MKNPIFALHTRKIVKSSIALCIVICLIIGLFPTVFAETIDLYHDSEFSESLPEGLVESAAVNDEEFVPVPPSESSDISIPVEQQNLIALNGETESENSENSDNKEEPKPESFKVIYQMGMLGKQEEIVASGAFPVKIPEPKMQEVTFLGWFLADGTQVSPESHAIQGDTIFYAKLVRNIKDILDTDSHKAYINGYANGTFKMNSGISRGETAVIFYKLLRNQDRPSRSFSDVPSSQWLAKAIGVIAELGAVSGYDNGKFLPAKNITRAEFVKIACAFDTLKYGASGFSDVPKGHWAENYVHTAVGNGWIKGYNNKTFRPDAQITRAEAVTIVNSMLGRYPPSDIKTKVNVRNFFDVYPGDWAYGQIAEASTTHTSTVDHVKKTEVWTDYQKDTSAPSSKWIVDEGVRYYLLSSTRKFARGEVVIDKKNYYFDPNTSKPFTGFRYYGGWKRYYLDGMMQDDISKLNVVKGPYYIKVYKKANYVIIYAKDGDKGYKIPVKAMIASCGYPTPTGTFKIPAKFRWLRMVGNSWAQYCTQISGDFLFHSVPAPVRSNLSLYVNAYNNLGTTQSLGCIRLTVADAKWVYDNCAVGSTIYISSWETAGPLTKPTAFKLPYWHNWDPTDPGANWKCKQHGCHQT